MDFRVVEGQSLLDISIRASGDALDFDLALENDLSFTDDLHAGQIIRFTGTPISKPVADYYRTNGIIPATAGYFEPEAPGIGNMEIGSTFLIG